MNNFPSAKCKYSNCCDFSIFIVYLLMTSPRSASELWAHYEQAKSWLRSKKLPPDVDSGGVFCNDRYRDTWIWLLEAFEGF